MTQCPSPEKQSWVTSHVPHSETSWGLAWLPWILIIKPFSTSASLLNWKITASWPLYQLTPHPTLDIGLNHTIFYASCDVKWIKYLGLKTDCALCQCKSFVPALEGHQCAVKHVSARPWMPDPASIVQEERSSIPAKLYSSQAIQISVEARRRWGRGGKRGGQGHFQRWVGKELVVGLGPSRYTTSQPRSLGSTEQPQAEWLCSALSHIWRWCSSE